MAQKSMLESVKGEIVSAIKGIGDIVNAVVDTVSGMTSTRFYAFIVGVMRSMS